MPRLNLLPENDLDLHGIILFDKRNYGSIDGIEHLAGEWADIV
jgi:hypothetical protein